MTIPKTFLTTDQLNLGVFWEEFDTTFCRRKALYFVTTDQAAKEKLLERLSSLNLTWGDPKLKLDEMELIQRSENVINQISCIATASP